jgi:hypothetical protein
MRSFFGISPDLGLEELQSTLRLCSCSESLMSDKSLTALALTVGAGSLLGVVESFESDDSRGPRVLGLGSLLLPRQRDVAFFRVIRARTSRLQSGLLPVARK